MVDSVYRPRMSVKSSQLQVNFSYYSKVVHALRTINQMMISTQFFLWKVSTNQNLSHVCAKKITQSFHSRCSESANSVLHLVAWLWFSIFCNQLSVICDTAIYIILPPPFQVPVFLYINCYCTLVSIKFLGLSILLELQQYVKAYVIQFMQSSLSSFCTYELIYSILQILCIPILFAYPYMTYLSQPGLSIILNIASVIKNNLSVSISASHYVFIYLIFWDQITT